jgi:hypothetical protein
MMQYSGNDVSALVLTTDTADRMAGKLTIDDSAATGQDRRRVRRAAGEGV